MFQPLADLTRPPLSALAISLAFSLSAVSAFAAAVPKLDGGPKSLPAVGVDEAKEFGLRQDQLTVEGDHKALEGYRDSSDFLLVMTADGKPYSTHLTGAKLRALLTRNIDAVEPVRTGTSCSYAARDDGRVLEFCAAVNATSAVPVFGVSLIERDTAGLFYAAVFITDDAPAARKLSRALSQSAGIPALPENAPQTPHSGSKSTSKSEAALSRSAAE